MIRFVVVVPGFVPGIRVFLCPCKDEDGLAMTAKIAFSLR